jgi:hypothetical protein
VCLDGEGQFGNEMPVPWILGILPIANLLERDDEVGGRIFPAADKV